MSERKNTQPLKWDDCQGDRFEIEADSTVEDSNVIAGVLVASTDGEEGAVWMTRAQAIELRDWLTERLRP